MLVPLRFTLALTLVTVWLPALAQTGENCLTYDVDGATASVMRVKAEVPEGRAYFQKQARACPLAGKCAWRQKAYLVPGDVVLVEPEHRGFRCAHYGTARGKIVTGFLPVDALEPDAEAGTLDAPFLAGTWVYGEDEITFTSAAGERVHAEGSAVWHGVGDNVHVGEFSGDAVPRAGVVQFGESDEGCRVTIRRRGPYLLVEDNEKCGGMNVTFRGTYVKKAAR